MRLHAGLLHPLAAGGTAVFAVLAAGGTAALALSLAPGASPWLGPATVACTALAFACGIQARRLAGLLRHGFRAVDERTELRFRADAEALARGEALAACAVRTETELQALRGGQRAVRLQKFVAEPSGLAPEQVLAAWDYRCRVADPDSDPGRDAAPRATLSDSRSLVLEVPLSRPLRAGETVRITEELAFALDLSDPAPAFMFQASYPGRLRRVAMDFEGPRPAAARYRIARGLRIAAEGELPVARAGEGARVTLEWEAPEPDQELAIAWEWNEASLPAPPPQTDRLVAEALARQAEMEERLAEEGTVAVELAEFAAAVVAPEEGRSAEDHPLIRAARARERLYRRAGSGAREGEEDPGPADGGESEA